MSSEGDFSSPFGSSYSIVPDLPNPQSNANSYRATVIAQAANSGPSQPTYDLPWVKNDQAGNTIPPSVFFPSIDIDGTRWDELFPYRFVVIDVTKQNAVVNGSKLPDVFVRKGTDISTLEFNNFGNQWIFQLPITPQQLNIQDIFAINTIATLRGVSEEHNGVKFKMINATGSFGVWPNRQSVTKPPSSPSILQSVFGGTLEAFSNLSSSVSSVINVATGNSAANKPVTPRPESTYEGLISTGYYSALFLQQFLEQYAEAKKNPANVGWRLVFDIPKQNQSFVVSPIGYTWQQNQQKAMEYLFSLQLKAWRRIDLNYKVVAEPSGVSPLTPGILQRIQNTIFAAREACSAAINLIGAVRSDVEAPLNALRQTAMFVKDLAGVAITAADLPAQLITDYKSGIASVLNSRSVNQLTGDAATDPKTILSLKALQASIQSTEGLSLNAVSNGQIGVGATQYQSTDPAQNIFTSPESNFLLIDQVPIDAITLTVAQQGAVDDAIDTARATTVDQLKQFRATIQTLALQLSNNFGTGDAFVSKVYNLPAPISQISPITLDNYDLLKALYDTMQAYDLMTASTEVNDDDNLTSMEYVAGLAASSGITFNIPNSKIVVPVPFGLTVEGLAARYLGDPQRWIEIVTLNQLRDPYIDENGFQYPLLSNAAGRNVTVGNNTDLFLGQTVILQSSTQVPTARTILGIDTLSATSFLLTLDGLPNLQNFVTADGAYIQAYLPGTVNSQQKIFIPSDIPVSNQPNIVIPALASSDPLSGLSLVDLLLTETGDIAVNVYGDFRYAYGMTNIVQALRIKFGSVAGKILLHPEFGLSVQPGTINSTIQAQDIFRSINEMIQADTRFAGVATLQLILNGPTMTINVGVILAGNNGVFPLSFTLNPSVI
jgi:hypothetical protein